MPLTVAGFKSIILSEIGDDGSVSGVLDALWTKNDARGPIWLQYLYTKRDAIQVLKGNVWQDVNVHMLTRSGLDLSDKYKALTDMYDQVCCEIAQYVGYGIQPVVTDMAAETPVAGNPGYPDPSNPLYRGDPTAVQRLGAR